MKQLLILCITTFTLFACHKDNPSICTTCTECKEGDGISAPKCVWKANSSKELTSTVMPFLYKDVVVISKGGFGSTQVLQFFNKNTGEKLGEWSDYPADAPNSIDGIGSLYAYDNVLVVANGSRVFGISFLNFKTLWMARTSTYAGDGKVFGFNDKCYHYTAKETGNEINLFEIDVKTGKYREITSISGPRDSVKLDIANVYPFIHNQDTMILLCNVYYYYDSNYTKGVLNVYNVTKKQSIYEKILNPDYCSSPTTGGIFTRPVIRNDKMYYSGFDGTYAFDLMTGKLVWKTPIPKHATTYIVGGDPKIGDNYLYVTTEDGYIRCYDPESGVELWKADAPQSILPLLYDNGFLFYRGASYNLKVFDTKARKLKWDYQLNANKKDRDRFVNTYIIPDPATGRFYTTDFMDVYCFEKP